MARYRAASSGTGSTSGRGPRRTRSGWRQSARSSWALPYLYSPVAYAAITSIAVIGLYVAYIAPVFLRLRAGDKFQAGPWSLGRWSRPIGIVATIWVVFIFVLFMLPQVYPITIQTFNYTPVVFLVVLGGAAIWYQSRRSTGSRAPRSRATPDELRAIEKDLEVI